MHAFKFISVSAIFLLALMQGAVAQYGDLVPLGGLCVSIAGAKPCAAGKCCILGPDRGVCKLKCPKNPSDDTN
ncbi:hypothetical protein B0H19DRAFT_1143705 [Mycena capillaripes]|nr:hypothetical protein B0H19DRAFT_1143705 [Mycena capillaripes]